MFAFFFGLKKQPCPKGFASRHIFVHFLFAKSFAFFFFFRFFFLMIQAKKQGSHLGKGSFFLFKNMLLLTKRVLEKKKENSFLSFFLRDAIAGWKVFC